MKVLVANLGSTSFKYRLFDMATETQLAKGGVERIGAARSKCVVQIGDQKWETELEVPHHGVAVRACLDQLTDPSRGCLKDAREVSAIGFKAVHGGRLQGVFRIDDHVLQSMEEVSSVAPAHNPPYLAAMRQLAATVPEIPLVAAFETDFHSTIPDANKNYAIPQLGEMNFQSANGDSMALRIDTSDGEWRHCCSVRMHESSPVTWEAPIRSAPSKVARASQRPWA